MDDHPVWRDAVASFLREQPEIARVVTAATGSEAIELARDMKPTVALLDYMMSFNQAAATGIDVGAQIRSVSPDTRLAIVTGFPETRLARESLRSGAHAFLEKSTLQPDDLYDVVRAIAREQIVLAGSIAASSVREGSDDEDYGRISHGLTEREIEVLALIVEGASNREAARKLAIGEQAIKNHLRQIYRKLGVKNRTAAAAIVRREELIGR